ncbi:hypothetical protein M5689_004523 [Euphorbia peplus]|nr:hypothetical protein M5689_004523 [Euphorbia peplus]
MRIRKNRKFASAVHNNPHSCSLNQSPWDVIPLSLDPVFDSDSDSKFSRLQFERDTRLDTNANSDDTAISIERETEVVKRITTEKEEKPERIENEQFNSEFKVIKSSTSNAKSEYSGCEEYRVGELRRSKRRCAMEPMSLSSSRKDYYYYSEFGPLRGKKRVIEGDEEEDEIVSYYCY